MIFTIPIILVSTITGTANFAQETFPPTVQPYVPSAIGGLNLITAIATTRMGEIFAENKRTHGRTPRCTNVSPIR